MPSLISSSPARNSLMKAFRLIVGVIMLIAFDVFLTSPAAAQDRQSGVVTESATKQAAASDYAAHAQSYLGWVICSSGVIGLFILVLAVYMVSTVVRLHASLHPDVAAPPDQFTSIQELLDQGDHKGVISYVRSNDSYLCRVLTLGLVELPSGLAHARDYMERHGEAEAVEMENQISMLAV